MSLIAPGLFFADATTSLAESTLIDARRQVATIHGVGGVAGPFTLDGADAAFFEIIDDGLFLKANTLLDFETKATYDVTVSGRYSDPMRPGEIRDFGEGYRLTLLNTAEGTLVNGGFDTGDYTGWRTNFTPPNNAARIVDTSTGRVHDGTHAVNFNLAEVAATAVLTQTFGTFAGIAYQTSFWFGCFSLPGTHPTIRAEIVGVAGNVLASNLYSFTGVGGLQYDLKSFSFVADGSQATIRFTDVSPLENGTDPLLDSVSVGLQFGIVSIAATSADKAEGLAGTTSFTFTVTRTGNTTSTSTVNWAVSGADVTGADFIGGALPGGTLTFLAGETSKVITVEVAGDKLVEADELFTVTLSGGDVTIATATASGAIRNDDAVLSIAATSADKAEGQSGTTPFTFTVTRTGATNLTHSATWAVSGAAVTAADFFGGVLPTGTLVFAVGETAKTVTVNVVGDKLVEGDEAFVVTLSSTDAAIGTASAAGTIRNDDASLSIAAGSADKTERQSGATPFRFTVTRTGDTSVSHTATWAVSGAAVNGADFVGGILPTGSVTFAPGATTQTVTVDVAGDTTFEADEAFTVTLSSSQAALGTATATGTIRNDDASLSIAAASADKAEGQSGTTPFTFTVTRIGDISGSHTATWTVSGAAVDGADFVGGALPTGTVTLTADQTSKTVTVNVAGDTSFESDEAFTVTLSSTQASIGTATATGIIRNDDLKPNTAPVFGVLPGTVLRDEIHGVYLGPSVAVSDTELGATGNYGGAVLTVSRRGGATASDYFALTEGSLANPGWFPVLFDQQVAAEGETLRWSNREIATVARNSGGVLQIVFRDGAPLDGVNATLRRLSYFNESNLPLGAVPIDWVFSDGNGGAQGPGGALAATATTVVNTTDLPNTPIFSMVDVGDHFLVGFGGDDALDGGAGVDSFLGNQGNDQLYGGSGNDFLDGSIGDDLIYGEAGNDTMSGGPGADGLDGGLGLDVASYLGSTVGVVIDLAAGGSAGWAAGDTYTSIEGVDGSWTADVIAGTDGLNLFRTTWGNDRLDGRLGDDLFSAANQATARQWSVNIAFGAEAAALAASLGTALPDDSYGIVVKTDDIGARRYDLIRNIEHFAGSARNDVIHGNDLGNIIFASGGTDDLAGGGGFDYLVANSNDVVDLQTGRTTNVTGIVTTIDGFEGVYGNTGNETLLGDRFANRLDGRTGNDSLSGRGGNDHLVGGDGTDFLLGDGGNDVLEGGLGADRLDGGTGIDTAFYLRSAAGVEVDLLQGRGLGASSEAAGDRIVNVENLIGSEHDDTLTGDNGANTIAGDRGSDEIAGCDGDDVLYGDVLPTATAALAEAGYFAALAELDEVDCGCDGEGLSLTSMIDVLKGDKGNDRLYGQGGSDLLLGGRDADYLSGGTEFDILSGDEGDDTLEGGASFDFLFGGLGFDIASYAGSAEGVTVDLAAPWTSSGGDAAGNWISEILGQYVAAADPAQTFLSSAFAGLLASVNTAIEAAGARSPFNVPDLLLSIEGLAGSAFNDTLSGDGFDNLLSGGKGRDTLAGAGGNDTLMGGANKDILDGGTGQDIARYDDKTAAVSVVLAGATAVSVLVGGLAEDSLRNVEGIVGGSAADRLTGDGLANLLEGRDGDDILKGEGGDDTLIGGAGADALDGGAGLDTASYGDKTASVSITLAGAASADVTVGGVVEESIRNIENLVGGLAADTLVGDSLANRLDGGTGDDTLRSSSGNDILVGGAGKDSLDGGAGIDTARYDEKRDAVVVTLTGATYANVLVGGGIEDRVRNVENLIGGAGDDVLTGDDLGNLLGGSAGRDILDGASGIDTADFGDKTDSVVVALNGATDSVATVDGVDEDTLRNIENLIGGSGDDVLSGDSLANVLSGGQGDDLLRGGGGLDTAIGGEGSDGFLFDSLVAAANQTTVADFEVGQDTILIDNAAFAAVGVLGSLDPAAFALGSAAATASTRLFYNGATGGLFYDSDGTGIQAATQFATLKPGLALSAGDFHVV